MTDRTLFGREDLDKVIDAYDMLVEELGRVYFLQDDELIRQANENIGDVLAAIGYYDE
jgi:hypothetical protein